MAVFTEVSATQAQALLDHLALGRLTSLRGIGAGIENTNYFVDCEQGHYVLTLFERLTAEQLPFYLRLMQHLARRGVPVPEPHADTRGDILFEVAGKPAAIVDRLHGGHQLAPDAFHCAQVGATLARMLLAGRDFELRQPNLRGLAWWREVVPQLLPFLDAPQAEHLHHVLHRRSASRHLRQFEQVERRHKQDQKQDHPERERREKLAHHVAIDELRPKDAQDEPPRGDEHVPQSNRPPRFG